MKLAIPLPVSRITKEEPALKRIACVLTFAACFASLLAFSAFFSAAPASAIIGGHVDDANPPKYPYAGAIDVRPTGRTGVASGFLVSPTVFVTAGHVTKFFDDAGLDKARVTFDPVVPEDMPFQFEGTVHTHPMYIPSHENFGSGAKHENDMGVVIFDEPIPESIVKSDHIPKLPTEGLLDKLGPQGLQKADFTAVGYGVQQLLGMDNGGGPPQPDRATSTTRKFAHESFMALRPVWLHLQADEDGQTCRGDSGGPSLLRVRDEDITVGIHVGGNIACENTSDKARLDTPSAREFLGKYVELP